MKLYALLLVLFLFPISLRAMEGKDSLAFELKQIADLTVAVNANETARAIFLLQAGANIKRVCDRCRNPWGEKLIARAARSGNLPLVQAFLMHETPVNAMHNESVKQAAKLGHVEMVEFLLHRGASVQSAQVGLTKGQRNLPAAKIAEIQEIINEYRLRKCTI